MTQIQSTPLRLLFVSHSLPPAGRPDSNIGGMQRVAQDLFHALSDRPDIELIPLVLRTTWADTHRKVAPFLFRVYREIRRRTEDQSVDVVLFSSMISASLAVPLRKRLRRSGIRTATIAHGLDVTAQNALYQRFVPHVFRSLDAVLPISRATRDACLERGLDASKAFIVPNGIDINRFREESQSSSDVSRTPDRAEVSHAQRVQTDRASRGGDSRQYRARHRRELHTLIKSTVSFPDVILDEDALLLTSVGRQVKRKGFEWFVDQVMPLLPDNVYYWLAGDGPEERAIRSTIVERGLAGRVQLLGRVSDEVLTALYRGGDLFVMPNIPVEGDMEGFGVVLLEASLNGQPAIAAGIEGILDVVSPGENGVLVESGDAQGFADAILSFDRDRSKLAQLSANATRYTAESFSWPSVAERYLETLRGLMESANDDSKSVK